MVGRSRTAIAAATILAISTLIAAGGGSSAGATTGRHPAGSEVLGTVLHYRSGANRVEAPIKGLVMPTSLASSFLSPVATFKNRYLLKTGTQDASTTRGVAPRTTDVAISGTYDVVGMPRRPTEYEIVIACQGATAFGYFCGSAAHPAWEAAVQPKANSVSEGTYNFGQIPASATGWKVGIILLNGISNAGYYPSSGGALVAAKGSKKTVRRAVSMRFVAPEILATFRVAGAPRGYQFEFAAVVCASSVTTDQLGLYEEYGDCGITEGQNTQQIGIYATPGKWTVRYLFAPDAQNVEALASPDIVTKDFSVTGPKVVLNTLSSRAVANVTGTYLKPSVSGAASAQLLSENFQAAVVFVDVATNTEAAGVYLDPGSSTSFEVFLDAGTYAAYSEVVTPFSQVQYAQIEATQVVLKQLGSSFNAGQSAPTLTASYTIQPVIPTVSGQVSVHGLYDPADASGWDNVQPFSFIQVCPGSPFSLECSGAILVSPSELLGGSFALYGITGEVSVGFVYTDLADNVVVGPSVTKTASISPRSVALTAPYHNPTFWGDVTVSGDNNFELWSLWIQACPAAKAFSVSCAGGVSQSVNNFTDIFPPSTGSFKVGFGIDLPKGTWRIGAAGSSFATGAAQQLGPAPLVDVGTTYPLIELTAKA